VRNSWIVGAVAAAAVLVVAAGYVAFGPTGSRTPAPVAASTPAPAPAPAADQATGQPQPIVLADATASVELYPDDRILGSKDAPITMIEYASLTCPHCAEFSKVVVPQLRSEYIDKGVVKLVYRDYPLDGEALQAASVAQCVQDDKRYFALIETFFKLQRDWSSAQDVPAALAKIAGLAGLDKATVDKCLADKVVQSKIAARRAEAETKFDVNSTPTFVINGKVFKGVQTMDMLQATFKDMLPKG
jgi:protein-disulfide isomerase